MRYLEIVLRPKESNLEFAEGASKAIEQSRNLLGITAFIGAEWKLEMIFSSNAPEYLVSPE